MTLDIEQPEALLTYLQETQRIAPDEHPEIRPLAGGVSNRTVWVGRPGGEAWVIKQALEKLRVPVDWFSDPQRVHREALGLRWLAELAPLGSTPALIFEDHAHHIVAMEAVARPHANWKAMLLEGQLKRVHIEQFATLLATIQRRAYERRPETAPVFADRTFFESLRLEPYYGYSAAQVPETAGFLRDLIAGTRTRPITLVHGDYSPKNVLIHRDRLVLLDFEVIHFGDPAFDLGFSLTHFLSKAHHLPPHRAAFADAATAYWHTYRNALSNTDFGEDLEQRAVRHTLGCLLARVAGRSPLEYLDPAERQRQQSAVIALLADLPKTVPELISRFLAEIEDRGWKVESGG